MKLAMILWLFIIGIGTGRHFYQELRFWIAVRRAEKDRDAAAAALITCSARLHMHAAALEACVNNFSSKH